MSIRSTWCRLNNLWGIRLRIHPLLTMVFLLSAVTGHFVEIITLFGIVLIHELGHVAAAKHFGWRMGVIQLTPFGGVAPTDEAGSIPAKQEIVVAVCGPLMNALMIGFGILLETLGIWTDAWTRYWTGANLTLLAFNLLPILPLDGGRLLQSAFSLIIPYRRTLAVTVYLSMIASAVLFGAAISRLGQQGLELNLAMISTFLIYSNWNEWRMLPYRFLRFLMRRFQRVAEWNERGTTASPIIVTRRTSLPQVVERFMREQLHIVLVMDERGRLIGILPEEMCIEHFLSKKKDSAVHEIFM
jgi:stage IV sporulation protein FB